MGRAESEHAEISPWTSGSWHFDPKKVTLVSPPRPARQGRKSSQVNSSSARSQRASGKFGLLPEYELLRVGYISLFAFSGFILALLVVMLTQ